MECEHPYMALGRVVAVMRGTIYINAAAGRALRKERAALLTTHVLHCAGDFRAGDRVYLVVRGDDGGQGSIATGIVQCDGALLWRLCGRSTDACDIPIEKDDPFVVMLAQDMEMLWRSAG